VIAVSIAMHAAPAAAQAAQRTLVTSAEQTLTDFLADRDMGWIRRNLAHARAVIITPEMVRGGFILGGAGGRAVVLARDRTTGRWVGPAFYTLATASVGLQAGVSASEVVTLVMTDAGLHQLLSSSVRIGSDVAVAAGPVGHGTRQDLLADFVSFSRSEGAYVGLDLVGTVVATAQDWNRIYYGKPVDASDILVRQSVRNRQARELLNLLQSATKD
jgi:SH3 domain-containing YSC84-like protein 1